MPKTKNRGHRETRKPQQELPQVPDLGTLSMPRKGNRAAAKYVAAIGVLWDRRRADRKARKNALARQDAISANPRRKHLDKAVREQMLGAMPGWSFDHQLKAFVAIVGASASDGVSSDRLEELLDAVIDLGPETVTLRVSGLTFSQAARVRGYLGQGSMLVILDRHFDDITFALSGHTRTR